LLNFGALPFLVIAAVAVLWLMNQRRAASAIARG